MKKDVILREFTQLCKIPRPSGHEEAAAAYLTARLRELGVTAHTDEYRNVIGEVPATVGCENAPLTILQAHSDMVCVGAADNKSYNPLTSPIKTVIEGNRLHAVDTSLGADDGIGIATILSLLDETADFPHGPLRLLFTAGEEVDMQGAAHLEPQYLQGPYMINCDWDEFGSVCLGCAGGVSFRFVTAPRWAEVTEGTAFEVELCGLKGGHSGAEIGEGRANALHEMALYLRYLTERGLAPRLAGWRGGSAHNVIPGQSTALLVVPEAHAEAFVDGFERVRRFLIEKFGKTEKSIRLSFRSCPRPSRALTAAETARVAGFLAAFPQGVEAMSDVVPNMVETSANMGMLHFGEEVSLEVLARSNNDARLHSFAPDYQKLAGSYGFDAVTHGEFPCWQPTKNGRLQPLAAAAWERRQGCPPREIIMHAGLECGFFANGAEPPEIISLGPAIRDIHSVKETLLIDTLAPTALWISDILADIARQ